MKVFEIRENEAGQRLDKYLGKLLREAPKSFYYKMLRKKNITLNGKKAQGNEFLAVGDSVTLFLSDETFEKFSGSGRIAYPRHPLEILYEDEDVILINKPAGMLSQPGPSGGAPSLVEYLIGYLLDEGSLTEEEFATFRPSVCNRLDRNTSGIVAAGKSLAGLQELSRIFRERTVHKDYLCLVKGKVEQERHIRGYLCKDETSNKVTVSEQNIPDSRPIETKYRPLEHFGDTTLLEVRLITGLSHQIRAHLASEGHPIVGDSKYGDNGLNRRYGERYRLKHQLLHAYRLTFPAMEGRFQPLSHKVTEAPLPEIFEHILREKRLEESKK